MSYEHAIQEARILRTSTTCNTSFTALNDGDWTIDNTDCLGLPLHGGGIDTSGLVHEMVDNPLVKTKSRQNPAGIQTLRQGEVKLALPLNSNDGTGQNVVKLILGDLLGGVRTPSQDSTTLDSTGVHTNQLLYAAGVGAVTQPGEAVLVGTRGDTRGNGEVHVISTEPSAASLQLATQCLGIPADDDVIWHSHTVYPDFSVAQKYFDLAIITADSGSPVQYNLIGCYCTALALTGLDVGAGQLPVVEITLKCVDWRLEPDGTKATIATEQIPTPGYAMDRGLGGVFIGDNIDFEGESRGYLLGGNLAIDPGWTVAPLRSPLGVNGVAGAKKIAGRLTGSFDALNGEGAGPGSPVPDLTDDCDNGTKKHLRAQFGHAAGACVCIEMQEVYIDKITGPVEVDMQSAMKIEFHAGHRSAAAYTALYDADFRIHFFHA